MGSDEKKNFADVSSRNQLPPEGAGLTLRARVTRLVIWEGLIVEKLLLCIKTSQSSCLGI